MPIKNCLSWYKRVRLYRVYILVSYIHACIVYTHLYRIFTFVSYIHTYIAYRNPSFFGATWSLPIVNWFSYKIFATDSLFVSSKVTVYTYIRICIWTCTCIHIYCIFELSRRSVPSKPKFERDERSSSGLCEISNEVSEKA